MRRIWPEFASAINRFAPPSTASPAGHMCGFEPDVAAPLFTSAQALGADQTLAVPEVDGTDDPALAIGAAKPGTTSIARVCVLIANTAPVSGDATKTLLPPGATAKLAGEITCARTSIWRVAAENTSTAPAAWSAM